MTTDICGVCGALLLRNSGYSLPSDEMCRASGKRGGELKICADGSIKIWHYGLRKWVETEPCGTYGCARLKVNDLLSVVHQRIPGRSRCIQVR